MISNVMMTAIIMEMHITFVLILKSSFFCCIPPKMIVNIIMMNNVRLCIFHSNKRLHIYDNQTPLCSYFNHLVYTRVIMMVQKECKIHLNTSSNLYLENDSSSPVCIISETFAHLRQKYQFTQIHPFLPFLQLSTSCFYFLLHLSIKHVSYQKGVGK